MSTFITILVKVLGYILIFCAIADMLQWAFTGTYSNTAGTLVTQLVSDVAGLPTQILCMIQNLFYALINVAIAIIWNIVPGLPSPAPTIATPSCP